MIYIGLGANLPSPVHGPPEATLAAALTALESRGVRLRRRSGWWRSAPVPASDQPWFVNGVALVATDLSPTELLHELLAVEAAFGRVRTVRNAPRLIDLDLLDYGGLVQAGDAGGPILPHPRLHERAFVLYPLAELAPDWRHPRTGQAISDLINALPPGQSIMPAGAARD